MGLNISGHSVTGYTLPASKRFESVADVIIHWDYRNLTTVTSGLLESHRDQSDEGLLLRTIPFATVSDGIRYEDIVSTSTRYQSAIGKASFLSNGAPHGLYWIGKFDTKGESSNSTAFRPCIIETGASAEDGIIADVRTASATTVGITYQVKGASPSITYVAPTVPNDTYFLFSIVWTGYAGGNNRRTRINNTVTTASYTGSLSSDVPSRITRYGKRSGGNIGIGYDKFFLAVNFSGLSQSEIIAADSEIIQIIKNDSEYTSILT